MSGILSVGGGGNVGGAGSFYGTPINQSLRFEDGDSPYLNRTFSSGNQQTWTWSAWVKRGNFLGNRQTLFAGRTTGSSNLFGFFNPSSNAAADTFGVYLGANADSRFQTTRVFRDPNAWYHLVVVLDTTNGTAGDRFRLYVNGVRETVWTRFDTITQNQNKGINENLVHTIGEEGSGGNHFDGYMAEVVFLDGVASDPTTLGLGETKDGIWVPKDVSGLTYGTNGFYLNFSDSSAIGDDTSGNSNDWTANNLAATDVLPDSPTNGFATWNPLQPTGGGAGVMTLSEGNLKATGGSSIYRQVMSNMSVLNGKWYTETYISAAGYPSWGVGWHYGTRYEGFPSVQNLAHLGYYTGGNVYFSSFGTSYSNLQVAYSGLWSGARAPTTGDVIGCAADFDNGKFWWSINGEWVNVGAGAGDPSAGTNASQTYTVATYANELKSTHYVNYNGSAILNVGQDSTFAGAITAGGNADSNGVGDFKYAVPSGFLALANVNLPEPTIIDGSEHFTPYLFTADNTTPKARTGVGFAPDLLWFKDRTTGFSHNVYDTVRGANKGLQTNNLNVENSYTLLPSFDADGFTTSTDGTTGNILNYSSDSYVAWSWKAGSTAVSNTDGSITSSVSANPDAGFSIVSWTGNNTTNATAGHGLTTEPQMIIAKARTYSNLWQISINDSVTGTAGYLAFGTGAINTSNPEYLTLADSSTLIFPGYDNDTRYYNNRIEDYVAYCFHSVEAYSKIGKWVGNGSADGPMIVTGFRPSFILAKKSSASGDNWTIYDTARDPYNVTREYLIPNSSQAAASTDTFDILSNGFKIRTSGAWVNTSAATYTYYAIAESPQKFANAR